LLQFETSCYSSTVEFQGKVQLIVVAVDYYFQETRPGSGHNLFSEDCWHLRIPDYLHPNQYAAQAVLPDKRAAQRRLPNTCTSVLLTACGAG
jgi:hypothetical protein